MRVGASGWKREPVPGRRSRRHRPPHGRCPPGCGPRSCRRRAAGPGRRGGGGRERVRPRRQAGHGARKRPRRPGAGLPAGHRRHRVAGDRRASVVGRRRPGDGRLPGSAGGGHGAWSAGPARGDKADGVAATGEPHHTAMAGGDAGKADVGAAEGGDAGRGDPADGVQLVVRGPLVVGEPEVAVRSSGDRGGVVDVRVGEGGDDAGGGDPPDRVVTGEPQVAVRPGGDRSGGACREGGCTSAPED